MMLAGALGFAASGESPYFEIAALAFGVGVGLTIDEFALWVHLEDVYWAEEGRRSIDATVIAISHRYYEGVTERYDSVLELKGKWLARRFFLSFHHQIASVK